MKRLTVFFFLSLAFFSPQLAGSFTINSDGSIQCHLETENWEQQSAHLVEQLEFCARAQYLDLVATDFSIRREIIRDQVYTGRILLWVVVAVTITGLGLSVYQIYKSLNSRTAEGRDLGESKISLKGGEVSVQSSVVGLLILTVSMAFFTVYVLNVYEIEDPENLRVLQDYIGGLSTQGVVGGLGSPLD